jgi:hypothetical protein
VIGRPLRSQEIPPVEGTPRFDVTVLVETTSPEAIAGVWSSEAFERLNADFVMGARNTRRIGDTEKNVGQGNSFLLLNRAAALAGIGEIWHLLRNSGPPHPTPPGTSKVLVIVSNHAP